MADHIEARGYPLRCVCGFQASDRGDLNEHVLASMHDDGRMRSSFVDHRTTHHRMPR